MGYLAPLTTPFLVAFVCVLVLSPICRRVALAFSLLDRPGGKKIHQQPTPLLGGLAIAIAQAAGVIAAYRARGLVPVRHLRIEGWSSLLLRNAG